VLEKDDAQPEWLASACLGIGRSYEASGRLKQAKQMYLECVKRPGPADIKKQAEDRLSALESGTPGSSTSLRDSGGAKKKRSVAPAKQRAKKAPAKKVVPARKKAPVGKGKKQ